MSQTTQPPTIAVGISFDLSARQWIASCAEPALSVRAHAYASARRRMRRALERACGAKVTVAERLTLPPPLARALCQYQRRHRLYRMLTSYVREKRMPLAYELLELQMSQADIAGLLDMSAAQLGVLLERDASKTPVLDDACAAAE